MKLYFQLEYFQMPPIINWWPHCWSFTPMLRCSRYILQPLSNMAEYCSVKKSAFIIKYTQYTFGCSWRKFTVIGNGHGD